MTNKIRYGDVDWICLPNSNRQQALMNMVRIGLTGSKGMLLTNYQPTLTSQKSKDLKYTVAEA